MKRSARTHSAEPLPAKPDQRDVLRLGARIEPGCISIYMNLPLQRARVNTYRARLRQLVWGLERRCPTTSRALTRIKGVEEFAEKPDLWMTDARGLAIFALHESMETYYLRHAVRDLATIGDHFHVKPILQDLAPASEYADFMAARERYRSLSRTERVVTDYDEILEAARAGLVETVFVAGDREQWVSGSRIGFREDIFDRIAVETRLTRGRVFVVRGSQIPSAEGACAILRDEPPPL